MPVEQQIRAVVWALVVGTGAIVVIWAVIRGGWWRKPLNDVVPAQDASPEPNAPVHEFPGGVSEAHGPVPLIVKLVIVGVLVWTVVYVVLYARAGFTFA